MEERVFEEALASGWRLLRFRPDLEAAFERDTGQGRTLRHVLCNLLGVATFWVLSSPDTARFPEVAGWLPILRWVAISVALGGGVGLLFLGRRWLRPWHRETVTAVGSLLIACYTLAVASQVNTTEAVTQLSGSLLIFLHASIGARLQFRYALGVNLVNWLGHAVIDHGADPQAAAVASNQLLLFGSVMLFGSVGNWLLEIRERRGYLLQCLKARRHHALLADAQILRQLAIRDGLTQLYNRRHFEAELTRAWNAARESGRPVGLLQVDVDHFKAYNDRYGHPEGDRCLIRVSAALTAAAENAGGIAARVGGEEFALLMPGLDDAALAHVADALCRAVRGLGLAHAGSRCANCVTVSVGAAAAVPRAGLVASALVEAADAALYLAKRQGRDRWAGGRIRAGHEAAPGPARVSGDSLAPAPEALSDDLLTIERLSGLLSRGLRWLHFPHDIETAFQERDADQRRRLLALLVFSGLAMTLGYAWMCRSVLGDVADLLLARLQGLAVGAGAVMLLAVRLRVGWRVREGLVTALVLIFALCIVWTESRSSAPTIYTALLAVCLLPMFSSLIAAQSLLFSLIPSLVICIGCAVLFEPELVERRPMWLYTVGVIWVANLYSLVGGYLLELASRRTWLLNQLRLAQLSVLRHNTEHLQRLATLDPLTRLPNRRHFEDEFARLAALCAASRRPLALLIVDIDHFKHYNDGYGHPAGDACLRRVGAALAQWTGGGFRPPDGGSPALPARLGGEEFAVLLEGADASTALAAAQQLRNLLRDLRIEHHHSPVGRFLTVSVGAASRVLGSPADARLLLAAADAALYRAKGLGRDQVAA